MYNVHHGMSIVVYARLGVGVPREGTDVLVTLPNEVGKWYTFFSSLPDPPKKNHMDRRPLRSRVSCVGTFLVALRSFGKCTGAMTDERSHFRSRRNHADFKSALRSSMTLW